MNSIKPYIILGASLLSSVALGQNVITNFMSPVVSYQYPDNLGSEALTNGGIESPIISYQYYEWPGNGILSLQYSPTVSYYYQFLDAPTLNIVSTSLTPTTSETKPAYLISPPSPSQLMAYHGGIFTTNLASVDPNQMTIVLTHGWIPLNPVTFYLSPIFTPNGVDDWPTVMAAQLRAQDPSANIVAWNWKNAATSPLNDPEYVGIQTPGQGTNLGVSLLKTLGPNYSSPIHFIGHSFGTLVNSYAANFLEGNNWSGEAVSPTPWPGTDMQMTLFDEAEVGADKDFTLNSPDLDALISGGPNLLTAAPYYHPLPKQFRWADNYISAVGLLQSNAANVILTNGFPADAPNPYAWFNNFGAYHGYPAQWYEETIEDDATSVMGFQWSFENGGLFSQAPTNGSVYLQAFNGTQWDLTQTNWNYGTNWQAARFQEYRGTFASSSAEFAGNTIIASGTALGQGLLIAGGIEWLVELHTGPASPLVRQLGAQYLSSPESTETNIPAYAWIQLLIPTNAVSMSFNYIIQGNWQSDALAVALNGTNVLFLPGNEIETNVLFNSGAIDVSSFSGQTNEFFVGIVGSTSTNAQLTIENCTFCMPLPPLLQAQASNGNLALSWPMSGLNCDLQTTTNIADPSSWTTLTNTPAVVNFRDVVVVKKCPSNRFFRLVGR